MNEHIIINRRFCGPPTSGNGGYSCGMLANFVGYPAEVRLLSPPPLEVPLTVKQEGYHYLLLRGEELVARATAATVDMEVPDPPTMDEARQAAPKPEIFDRHAFPGCFVCGPQREPGDGLRIFAGPVPGRNYVAAPWIPDSSLTDSNGIVRDEIICAALDCPGAWAVFAEKLRVIVLGTLAVDIIHRMRAGDPCIVVGWKIGEEGRKLYAGTAVFSATGELYARARATWIELK
ncbi:MAG: hypothetical protein GXY92_08315 [Syntrophomonadaceae bacterium]|mgnify:CR=1 FL=1|nr:hypothetical protein [Syntrophomonadaceae bacterium]